jgi:hypothetical protein
MKISLGERGKEIHALVAQVYEKHAQTIAKIGGIQEGDFSVMGQSMARLDRFWEDQIKYRL